MNRLIAAFLATAFALLVGPAAADDAVQTVSYRLDNGMEVVLKEQPGSPMVSSMVFIRSGSKYETPYENGITHFLEHLLFDGTLNQTRKELDDGISDLGGYINAFTRKELTAYLVLLPKQYIRHGMTVQADMLLNSVFPEEEMEKERKVVIEEIRSGNDRPGSPASAFFAAHAYAGTPYADPVIGYEPFISTIPREAVINYWKRYYRPENMLLLVIGDFNTENMRATVDSVFGNITLPVDSITTPNPVSSLPAEDPLTGQTVYDTVANVKSTYVDFSIAMPHWDDSLYLAADLLTRYLAADDLSPFKQALKGGDTPLATEVSASLITYEEFSRLDISVIAGNADNVDRIITTVTDELAAVTDRMVASDVIDGLKTSVMCDQIYMAEKLHYYGFILSDRLMATGFDFIETYPERLSHVTWADCQDLAGTWLVEPRYVVTVVRPADSADVPYVAEGMSEADVRQHFDTTVFDSVDLTQGVPLEFVDLTEVSHELVDNAVYGVDTLDNGMIAVVKSAPGSQVFAINVLGRNRTLTEPEGKAGITDFVNRCLERGTHTRTATDLSQDLASVGAEVTLFDNPWIPYDDRYTSRLFTFAKFQTIDRFADHGFHLFSDMILNPAFDPSEVERVRQSMLGIIGRSASSPREVARNGFYSALYGDRPFARPVSGTARSIAGITVDDLKAHHRRYYDPANLIISVVSQRPVDQVMAWIEGTFGRLCGHPLDVTKLERPEPVLETRSHHDSLESQQVAIYFGNLVPGDNSTDAPAIRLATSILSERLFQNLRERQGLAYSVGAGTQLAPDFGWYYAVMSTGADNLADAVEGLRVQIERLRLEGVTQDELFRARNYIWGRLMSAKLSRLNQAYYLAYDAYFERPVDFDSQYLQRLQAVTREDIRRVASKFYRTDSYVISTAGPVAP